MFIFLKFRSHLAENDIGVLYDENNGGCTMAAIDACQDKNYVIAVNTASYRPRYKYCCSEILLSTQPLSI